MKPVFPTTKKANKNSNELLNMFNNIPAFLATGGQIIFVSDDFLEVHLKFNLTEQTMNYHKSGFGGAVYSSLDPIYPIQLINILGDDYVIWDLAGKIDYLKPIFKDVYAKFELTQKQIQDIKTDVKNKNRSIIDLEVEYTDFEKNIYAKAIKTIYIADREYFNNKHKKQ